jgi:N-acetyl-gamma-glutamyl-phosphate reductase
MKVSVIGATGYAGAELIRLLMGHPQAELVAITSESQTGTPFHQVYPHFQGICELELASLQDIDEIAAASDVLFIALPHGHAMEVGKKLSGSTVKLIDLGADYRFTDTKIYEAWYKVPHTHPGSQAVYGLTELFRDDVKTAKIVGNPGCFTTASILALAPLARAGLVDLTNMVVDAKSGVSGAGRGLSLTTHYSETVDSIKAYGIATHRHTPEIEQALARISGQNVLLNFTPHLVPMTRGILATCYATMKQGVTAKQVDEAYYDLYAKEFFIRLLGRGGYPVTKNTRGSNYCDIAWHVDERTRRVIAVSAIDNLVKGAAGQAVQNMNVMFGCEETSGLKQVPLFP